MTRQRYRNILFGLMALASSLLAIVGTILILMPYFLPAMLLHCNFHLMAGLLGISLLCVFAMFHVAMMCQDWLASPRWKHHPDWEGVPAARFKEEEYDLRRYREERETAIIMRKRA